VKWWNSYWFRPSPYLDLAMVRIVVVGCQLWLFSTGKFSAESMAALWAIPAELYDPITLLRLFLLPFGWDHRPTPEFMSIVYYITLISGILAFVGFWTRSNLLIFMLGNAFMVSYVYSHSDFHHTEAPLIIGVGILAMSPAGRVLSVDHWISKQRAGERALEDTFTATGPMAGWPRRLIQWLFVLFYLSAVLSKLVFEGGLDWLNGYTLQYYMIQDTLRHGTLLGGWVSQFHEFVLVSQYMVIGFQATFALAVIFPLLRWIYVPLGLGFHAANWILLSAPFPEWMALYAVLIPWQRAYFLMRRSAATRTDPQLAT
jgi:HTTM domain